MQHRKGLSNVVFCQVPESFHHYLFAWAATTGRPLIAGILACASIMAFRAAGEVAIAVIRV